MQAYCLQMKTQSNTHLLLTWKILQKRINSRNSKVWSFLLLTLLKCLIEEITSLWCLQDLLPLSLRLISTHFSCYQTNKGRERERESESSLFFNDSKKLQEFSHLKHWRKEFPLLVSSEEMKKKKSLQVDVYISGVEKILSEKKG